MAQIVDYTRGVPEFKIALNKILTNKNQASPEPMLSENSLNASKNYKQIYHRSQRVLGPFYDVTQMKANLGDMRLVNSIQSQIMSYVWYLVCYFSIYLYVRVQIY